MPGGACPCTASFLAETPQLRRCDTVRVMSRLLLAVVLAAGASSAQAVTYLGTTSCGQWVQASKARSNVATADRNAYRQWVSGFLSGSAVQTNLDVLNDVDEASIATWMDNYCTKQPLDKLIDGADKLFDELKARQRKR